MTDGLAVETRTVPEVPVLEKPSPARLREMLVDLVVNDLHGPAGGPEEELLRGRGSLTDRYILGTLAPKGTALPALEDDDFTQAGTDSPEDEGVDPGARVAASRLPSSFGLTFTVAGDVTAIEAMPSWGQYVLADSDHAIRDDGSPARVWKRRPMGGQPIVISLAEGEIDTQPADPAAPNVFVRGRVRERDGLRVVTLFLDNRQTPAKPKAKSWLFQAALEVQGVDGAAVFVCSPTLDDRGGPDQAERAAMAMRYRAHEQFATGHGVATHADPVLDDGGQPTGRATRIRTVASPHYEVPGTDAPSAKDITLLAGVELDMRTFGDLPREDIDAALRPLVRAYAAWIATRRQDLAHPDRTGLQDHAMAGGEAMAECDRALARIEDGIRLLSEHEDAFAAFRFMNRAMHQQRIRTIFVAGKKATGDGEIKTLQEIDEPKNRS